MSEKEEKTQQEQNAPKKGGLGARMVEKGLITEEELNRALEYQKDHDLLLGEALTTLGIVTSGELAAFIGRDRSAPIGELLIKEGYLNKEKMNAVLEYQRIHGGRLGSICVEMGFLTHAQLDKVMAGRKRSKTLLGDELLKRGMITREQLDEALELQKRTGGRLGDILMCQESVREEDLYRTLADMMQMGRLGSEIQSDDLTALPYEMAQRLKAVIVDEAASYVLVTAEEQLKPEELAELEEFTGRHVEQVLASSHEFFSCFEKAYRAKESHESVFGLYETQPDNSAIVTFTSAQIVVMLSLLLGTLLLGFVFNRSKLLVIIMVFFQVIYLLMALAKFYIVIRGTKDDGQLRFTEEEIAAIDEHDLPVYTILIPVYKEVEVIHHLLKRVAAMDYPKYKLEVRILLEEDDKETIEAINKMNLPRYFIPVVVPYSLPKTKPKACNYGLITCKGEYVVIYDAEDRPEPDQLKKAYLAFKRLPEDYVCVQAKLNYFNSRENWLTKLFTQEYSMWFELLLVGIMQLNVPIPLGGTSNHFKTSFLRKVGGWDPFNVTEDADLGIRLYKHHCRTAVIDSRTWEEANCDLGNWIRQRSRWLKGYMQTFFVHMRHPLLFVKQIGAKGMAGYLAMIFGTPFLPLINPIFWALLIFWLIWQPFWIQSLFPGLIYYIAAIQMIVGNFVFVYINMVGTYFVIRDCALKKHQPFSYAMIRYALLTPLYWVFMSIAAYKALFQLLVKPFYWEKTVHGLSDSDTTQNHPQAE
ncbi:MAG: glycosyltransferase [Lachnospiraceae bacterium]|nr:glycosyltransferase [Lachnospiraceae bacterium]